MNGESIYEAITNISDAFIADAEESARKSPKFRILLFAAMITTFMIGTAFAVWLLRPPSEAAEQDPILSAFLGHEDTIVVDESVDSGDYRVTLLGFAQGSAISKLNMTYEVFRPGATYAVTAVQRLDGSDMPQLGLDVPAFSALAFIQGIKPWEYFPTLDATVVVVDGILFILVGTADLEPFADHDIYLAISHEMSYSQEAFLIDEETGAYLPNEAYQGVNVVFSLPLDPSGADPERAAGMVREWKQFSMGQPAQFTAEEAAEHDLLLNGEEWYRVFDNKDSDKRASLAFELSQILSSYVERELPSKSFAPHLTLECAVRDGFAYYEYEDGSLKTSASLSLENHRGQSTWSNDTAVSTGRWQDGDFGMVYYRHVFVRDDDGTVWLKVYKTTLEELPQVVIDRFIQSRLRQSGGAEQYCSTN